MNENGNIFVICNEKIVELHSNGELVNLIEITNGYGITIDFTGIYFTDRHAIKKIDFIVYWKKDIHFRFPLTIRSQIKTLFILIQRKSNFILFHPQCILGYLPKDIFIEIISKIEFYV